MAMIGKEKLMASAIRWILCGVMFLAAATAGCGGDDEEGSCHVDCAACPGVGPADFCPCDCECFARHGADIENCVESCIANYDQLTACTVECSGSCIEQARCLEECW